ncbi:MAG: hypothetical protein K0S47_2406 [Herbinix sp.]|jgi:hypothetical protein|nr:hypothetical protein [Herbinix sp.]
MEIKLVNVVTGVETVIAANYDIEASGKHTITTDELEKMMCMGRKAAIMTGIEANAKIVSEGHIEWDMKKQQEYLYNADK